METPINHSISRFGIKESHYLTGLKVLLLWDDFLAVVYSSNNSRCLAMGRVSPFFANCQSIDRSRCPLSAACRPIVRPL